MATSYICEHSAAFSLVPALKELLETEFQNVVPLFPWITREMSKTSKLHHINDLFHILIMFPRRPKISEKNKKIHVTINPELGHFKEVAQNYGVPVIAGCPKATNFWELASCSEHVWFKIGQPELHEHLIPVESLGLGSKPLRLNEKTILSMVRESAIYDIRSFEQFVRDARESQPYGMYGAHYKPVYFLAKKH